jgi:hypothetical protein
VIFAAEFKGDIGNMSKFQWDECLKFHKQHLKFLRRGIYLEVILTTCLCIMALLWTANHTLMELGSVLLIFLSAIALFSLFDSIKKYYKYKKSGGRQGDYT